MLKAAFTLLRSFGSEMTKSRPSLWLCCDNITDITNPALSVNTNVNADKIRRSILSAIFFCSSSSSRLVKI